MSYVYVFHCYCDIEYSLVVDKEEMESICAVLCGQLLQDHLPGLLLGDAGKASGAVPLEDDQHWTRCPGLELLGHRDDLIGREESTTYLRHACTYTAEPPIKDSPRK